MKMVKKAIYKPKGKAREYCSLAINIYDGCGMGCRYCYVPEVKRKTREEHQIVKARVGVLQAIQAEAPRYRGQAILMCFTCDPYPEIEEELEITREAIRILHGNNIKVCVLTKAGNRSVRDFDLLARNPGLSSYGATLTFTDEHRSREVEPNAALPDERLKALRLAHEKGIPTWVSIEPVIDTEQSLKLISKSHTFIDEYKVGKLNHRQCSIDWRKFARDAVSLLNQLGKSYYIKEDLKSYMRSEERKIVRESASPPEEEQIVLF